jgi:hypothetical protein
MLHLEHNFLCDSDTWTIQKVDQKCLERFEIGAGEEWKSVRTDHMKNEKVLQRVKEEENTPHATK